MSTEGMSQESETNDGVNAMVVKHLFLTAERKVYCNIKSSYIIMLKSNSQSTLLLNNQLVISVEVEWGTHICFGGNILTWGKGYNSPQDGPWLKMLKKTNKTKEIRFLNEVPFCLFGTEVSNMSWDGTLCPSAVDVPPRACLKPKTLQCWDGSHKMVP